MSGTEVILVVSTATKAKAAGKAARGVSKAGGGTGKVLLSGGTRGRVARKAAGTAAKGAAKGARGAGKAGLVGGAGKVALKGGRRAASSGGATNTRYLKYGIFAIVGFAIGALIARSGEKEVGTSSSFTGTTGPDSPDPGSPAGQRGETWGSGTFVGSAGTGAEGGARLQDQSPAGPARSGQPEALRQDQSIGQPPFQQPDDPHQTGADRHYSDPSSGPLIGRNHDRVARPPGMPEQHEEVENRIRTRVGEDQRTRGMQHLNVEVNGEVAEIRGNASSEEAKQAVTEIAQETEGVEEVRNLMTVDPQDQTGGGRTPGTAAPDRP